MDSNLNKCTYCGKFFARERTLQVHLCEPKRRHLQKNEKWVQNAFMVFQRFYEIHQNNTKTKTYEQFCDSAYYNAFVKFGRYIMHVYPLYPEKYIEQGSGWQLSKGGATRLNNLADQGFKTVAVVVYPKLQAAMKHNPVYQEALKRELIKKHNILQTNKFN